MPGDFLDKVKNTRLFKEIRDIQIQYFEVLGPLSEALFGEDGKQEFLDNNLPFGVKQNENMEMRKILAEAESFTVSQLFWQKA